jgi:hypothetical protein
LEVAFANPKTSTGDTVNTAGAFALSLVAAALASVGIALRASFATRFALAKVVTDVVGGGAGLAGIGWEGRSVHYVILNGHLRCRV